MDELSCSTREAAEMLGICVRTAQLWVEQGKLRAWKTPGGHRRISRESVDTLLRDRKREFSVAPDTFDILIVEDEHILRTLLQKQISKIAQDLSIRSASNGIEGLINIGNRPPHILITDLLMPGLDGFQMIRTLMSSPTTRQMQMIVTTGLNNDEIRERGGLPSDIAIFPKPIQMSLLIAMIQAYYDGWSIKQKLSA